MQAEIKLCIFLAAGLAACAEGSKPAADLAAGPAESAQNPLGPLGLIQQPAPGPAQSADASYKIGDLPRYAHALIPGPGRDAVEQGCSLCHSLAYIYAQPPLNEAAWQAEIVKMVEKYGAKIGASEQKTILTYLVAAYGPERKQEEAAGPQGSAVYLQNCAMCHQATGAGLPGAFPPLTPHAAQLAQLPDGRAYLIDLLLYGLLGPIEVAGQAYNNVMPPLGSKLSDPEVAAVLNYVLHAWENGAALGHFLPITAAEVAAARAHPRQPQENQQRRPHG